MIKLIIGFVLGAVSMFLVIRNGYVSVKKKKKLPRDLEIGRK
jgi:hypothetical protein